MGGTPQFRVVTYNIHKCRGFDRKTSPARIIDVIGELQPDLLCLQEVVDAPGASPIYDQAGQLARALPEYQACFGANRPLHGGGYGNMTLSRFPVRSWQNLDITRPGREPRGALQTEIELVDGLLVHVFNVHLGTGFHERRFQIQRLMSEQVLAQPERTGSRLVLGDFNEWTRGLTSRLLSSSFRTFSPRHAARFPRTFPGMLPILTLDHCYYEPPLVLQDTQVWRSRRALIASDHLPLVADFAIQSPPTD